ncbi:MAG: hypothetical protein D6675_11490 [Gemmatimonadetes bacterium]|nr:MAG: hypothetical protein D6675_11490 [Gemmatimonadota bacterium]
MQRNIPLFLVFILGIIYVLLTFIETSWSEGAVRLASSWAPLLSMWAIVPATYVTLASYGRRLTKRDRNPTTQKAILAGVTYVAFFTMLISGLKSNAEGSLFDWMFRNIQIPVTSTMFSLLTFYIASAAYRAFRVSRAHTSLLMVFAVLVMVTNTGMHTYIPFGQYWNEFSTWFLMTGNVAAKRAILIGVAVGMLATNIRIIFGIERSWMGGGA